MERLKRVINIQIFALVFLSIAGIGYAQSKAAPASTGTAELDRTIKLASDDMNAELPSGSKVALLYFNSASDAFSDYVIEEMSVHLVRGKKLIVVDRKEIDLIRSEMEFQMSGEVSDESIQKIGKKLGAQFIISGSLVSLGDSYRFRTKVINVNSAAVETSLSALLNDSPSIRHLLSQGKTSVPQAAVVKTAMPAQTNTTGVTTPAIQGTVVPGANLAAKLTWLQKSADSHNTYIVEVNANENIAPHTFEYKGAINITIVLKGDNLNRTIGLKSHGTMFTIGNNITFILDNNITLKGHTGNTGPMISVGEKSGKFQMRDGSIITGNASGAVRMSSGTFEMSGGNIIGNTASEGGGVYINNEGTFTMTEGTISGNTAKKGGGVFVNISSSTAFTMRGGTITGNTAREAGGGVYVRGSGSFTKSGGTITGYSSDPNNGNIVRDDAGDMLARKGHAVYADDLQTCKLMRKETTAGPVVNLSRLFKTCSSSKDSTGDWDD